MIFRQTWKQVLDGNQTEFRLPAKTGEMLLQNPTRVKSGPRARWTVDKSYAIQPGKGRKTVGRILLLGIEEGTLGQLTLDDVQAEGFSSLEDFISAWESTHGGYEPGQPVWILRFEKEPTPEEKAARKREEQERQLWKMASSEGEKLSSVGHGLGEWQPDGDLQLKNTCTRCEGAVTVSVGEINMVAHIPLMHPDFCFADYPEHMEKAKKEWEKRLARAYEIILSAGRAARRGKKESQITD